jgi:secreted PhoX family phosphatase
MTEGTDPTRSEKRDSSDQLFTRRHVLEGATATGLLALGGTGTAAADGDHDHTGEPTLNRFAVSVYGAEITGLFNTAAGDLFFNVQHPNGEMNEAGYRTGAVGVVDDFSLHDLPRDFGSVSASRTPDQRDHVRTAKGSHTVLANGGDETRNGNGLGVVYDDLGNAMTAANNPDYNGFVPDPTDPDRGYLFTNWETQPGVMTRLTLARDADGNWVPADGADSLENINFRPVGGTWNNCFGSVSPWGTPLTSEESEPDAAGWYDGGGNDAFRAYLGEGRTGNPYRYGYIVELENPGGRVRPRRVGPDVTPRTEYADESTDLVARKRFAMGRFSHENCRVMPDGRTVYLSDDGSSTVFFKFVADEAGDLSAGTLYAAKAHQGSGRRAGEVGFLIDWLELAHGEEAEIAEWVADYDDQDPATAEVITGAEVRRWARGEAADDRVAFLESRKAAAAIGATNEWNKLEGVNVKRNAQPGDYMYVAMSRVNQSMSDGQGDVQVGPNGYGVVYRLPLESDYDVSYMEPAVAGGPNTSVCGGCPYDAEPGSNATVCGDCSHNPTNDDAGGIPGTRALRGILGRNRVAPDNTLANPDNIVVMDDGRAVIGEDSALHENNMIWILDPGEEGGATDEVAGRVD